MLTVGVDLAAEPRGTALAEIRWTSGGARLQGVTVGAGDDLLLATMLRADVAKVAIDAPLGWPTAFVDFVAAHRAGRAPAPAGLSGLEWRRSLSRRATDLHVAHRTRVTPMSVSADRIAAVAMRTAGLLAASSDAGQPVSRSGDGKVMEVYPAAALRVWGLTHRSYKGAAWAASLHALVDALAAHLPRLDWGDWSELCRRNDHAFDAVVCALIGRAAALGLTEGPTAETSAVAASEGWIHLPTGPLSALGTT